jgi:glyoxylase I family protein
MKKLQQALPARLHHFAYATNDQEATRRFYEDIIGLPLLATCIEDQYAVGEWAEIRQSFYGLGDGCALAFVTFSDPQKQEAWRASQHSMLVRISLAVDQATKDEIVGRLKQARRGMFSVDRGGCPSLYVRDPNGLLLEFTVDPLMPAEPRKRRRHPGYHFATSTGNRALANAKRGTSTS